MIASVVQADLKFDVNKLVQHQVEKACEKAKQAKQLSRAACLEIALKGDLTDMQYDYLHKSVPDKLVCLSHLVAERKLQRDAVLTKFGVAPVLEKKVAHVDPAKLVGCISANMTGDVVIKVRSISFVNFHFHLNSQLVTRL